MANKKKIEKKTREIIGKSIFDLNLFSLRCGKLIARRKAMSHPLCVPDVRIHPDSPHCGIPGSNVHARRTYEKLVVFWSLFFTHRERSPTILYIYISKNIYRLVTCFKSPEVVITFSLIFLIKEEDKKCLFFSTSFHFKVNASYDIEIFLVNILV